MGEVHQLIRDRGREEALRSEHARTVVEAAAAYLSVEETEVGFLYSGWCQAALPHKKLADDAVWRICPARATVQVSRLCLAGGLRVPALASAATSSASASTSTVLGSNGSPAHSFISAWFSCAGSSMASRNSA